LAPLLLGTAIGINCLTDDPIAFSAANPFDIRTAQLAHVTDRIARAGNENPSGDVLPEGRRTTEPPEPMGPPAHDATTLGR
jgi:hypothetical protein